MSDLMHKSYKKKTSQQLRLKYNQLVVVKIKVTRYRNCAYFVLISRNKITSEKTTEKNNNKA